MEVLTWYLLYIYIWYTNIYDICVLIKSLSSVQVAWKSPFSWKVAPRWLATRLRLRFSFYLGPHHPITDRQMIQKRSFSRLTTSICWIGEMINWHVLIKLLCLHFGKESNRGNCNLFFLWSANLRLLKTWTAMKGLRKWWSLLIFISPPKKESELPGKYTSRGMVDDSPHGPPWTSDCNSLGSRPEPVEVSWKGTTQRRKPTHLMIYMDVSENRGTPKWRVYNGKPH